MVIFLLFILLIMFMNIIIQKINEKNIIQLMYHIII